jgi:hypothetical protein
MSIHYVNQSPKLIIRQIKFFKLTIDLKHHTSYMCHKESSQICISLVSAFNFNVKTNKYKSIECIKVSIEFIKPNQIISQMKSSKK